MTRIGLIGLAVMIVSAMSAIATATASAPPYEFRAETYPVEWRGAGTAHRFEFGSAVIGGGRATFNTNEGGPPNQKQESTTLAVQPTYTQYRLRAPAAPAPT